MSNPVILLVVLAATLWSVAKPALADGDLPTSAPKSIAPALTRDPKPADAVGPLPPLAEGVVQLKFSELYKQPIGRRGLELSAKAKSLHGKRVRVLGYMARQCHPDRGRFLLAPLPLTLHEEEYGLADDLPPTTIHVHLAACEASCAPPYTPGLLLLTGRLEVGNRPEADGRISTVRLLLDPPPPGTPALASPMFVSQDNSHSHPHPIDASPKAPTTSAASVGAQGEAVENSQPSRGKEEEK